MYCHVSTITLAVILAGCGLLSDNSSEITYHHDVRPILDRRCGGCHAPGGVSGLVLDGAAALTPLMLAKINDGSMPPWPPGPLTPDLVGDRKLTLDELTTLRTWAAAGSPQGNPGDYHAPTPSAAVPPPSLSLLMVAPFHPTRGQPDQYRCFMLTGLTGGWITSLAWSLGSPAAAHHVGGIVISAAGVALLQARGLDRPDGWDCPGDYGPAPALAGLSATGTGLEPGFALPPGTGIETPVGGAIVMQVHYQPDAVPVAGDVSGVRLWIERGLKRAVTEYQFVAPVEVPCALGVSPSAANPCSRQYAFDHDQLRSPALAQQEADAALAGCGQTLAGVYAAMPWQQTPEPSFLVRTSCLGTLPYDGELLGVHLHMHTLGVSGRIDVQQPDGSWLTVLDIPRWRWTKEQGYMLRRPIPVRAGHRVRVSCVIDNGTAAQWGPAGPGRDGPAVPPLESQRYKIGGTPRKTEMCAAFLQTVRSE